MLGSETSTVSAPSLRYSAIAVCTGYHTGFATGGFRTCPPKNSFGSPILSPESGFADVCREFAGSLPWRAPARSNRASKPAIAVQASARSPRPTAPSPGLVERRGEGDHAPSGDHAVGWLEPVMPHSGRRLADRAAGVGAVAPAPSVRATAAAEPPDEPPGTLA